MRANRYTLAKLCLLVALAVPTQRMASAAVSQGTQANTVQLLAQGEEAAVELEGEPPIAISPDGTLAALTDEDNIAFIENEVGEVVAGPLLGAGGAVTALAFSEDGETLATGTNSGNVRYWNVDGTPKDTAFPAANGRPVTALSFVGNDKLRVSSQGQQGDWGLNGLPFGETAASADAASADVAATSAELSPWLWLIPLLGLLGAGLWALLGRKKSGTNPEAVRQTAPTATVPPPATDPETEREVSNRAQSVISTDRVTDESRVVIPPTAPPSTVEEGTVALTEGATVPLPADLADTESDSVTNGADMPKVALPIYESTDLESPDLEGTNLDLLTPTGTPDAAVAGEAALSGMAMAGLDADVESDEDANDEWDDNLDLTLDDAPPNDEPLATSSQASSQPSPPPVSVADVSNAGILNADDSEASTADMSIADVSNADILNADDSELEASELEASELEASELENLEPDALEPDTSDLAMPVASTPVLTDINTFEPTRGTVIAETETILDIEPTRETIIGDSAVIFGEAAATDETIEATGASSGIGIAAMGLGVGLATGAAAISTADANEEAASTTDTDEESSSPSAAQYNPSITNTEANTEMEEISPLSIEELATVDEGLAELPEGYGDSRIVLLPRDPKWAYAYWDISNEHKEELRQQGGQRLMLRLYDVADIDQAVQSPHSMHQQDCHEMARSWYLEVPVSDRDYSAEIGYLTDDDRWLLLARSAPIRVPPIYPSDWVRDKFVTLDWGKSLAGRTVGGLGQPYAPETASDSEADEDLPKIYDDLFALTQKQETLRVAGSAYGSMQQAAPGALSPSGNVSGQPGAALNASGLNMSGLNMSGVGPAVPGRSRNFWLVAEAELIVYGATEPDATLTIGDRVVPLNPDGTFRFHVSFPDGQIDYPIRAVAADGEQTRSICLQFERETPERNTNTKAEAEDEWF